KTVKMGLQHSFGPKDVFQDALAALADEAPKGGCIPEVDVFGTQVLPELADLRSLLRDVVSRGREITRIDRSDGGAATHVAITVPRLGRKPCPDVMQDPGLVRAARAAA